MPRPESEEIDAALPPPWFTTPIKAKCNDGAGHVNPDAERMETESEADCEKQFGESTGKKRCYAGPLLTDLSGRGPSDRMPSWRINKLNMKSTPR
jgi:hypothetical protein